MEADLLVTGALGVHQYLQKPLEPSAIRAAIERAGLVDELIQDPKVKTLISRIRTLPARPIVYVEVMRELRSSDSSPRVVGDLVGRIWRSLPNSFRSRIPHFSVFASASPHRATRYPVLGWNQASLVLGIEAFSRLDKIKLAHFSTEQVWKHSQSVANSARAIAEYVTNDTNLAQDAFTAALLHDIGKLALAVNFEDQYRDLRNSAREQNVPAWELEKKILGATHAEAGAYLLSLWGLPANVIEAVAHHHRPAHELAPRFSVATAVHLANAFEYAELSERSGFPEYASIFNIQRS